MRVGQWTFDSPENLGYDYSGWENHGEVYGVAPARPVRAGGRFSGYFTEESYIAIPNSYSLRPGGSSFYIDFWVEVESDGSIISGQDMWSVGIEEGQLFAVVRDRYGNERWGEIAELEYNTTYYVCVAFDRSIDTVFANVNGVKEGGFSIEGLKKLEPWDGTPTINPGPYEHFAGRLDNLSVTAGSLDEREALAEYRRGIYTHDYVDLLLSSDVTLILSYEELDDDIEFVDLSMSTYDLNTNEYTLGGHQIGDTAATGLSLFHPVGTGYISLEPREPEYIDEGEEEEEPEEGDSEPEFSEPIEITYWDYYPSIEFIVDEAEGELVNVEFGGTNLVIRFAGDEVRLEERSGPLVDSITAPVNGWTHGVVVVEDNGSTFYLNGQVVGQTSINRDGITGVTLLDGFDGWLGTVAMFSEPLDEFTAYSHYRTAYAGRGAYVVYDRAALIPPQDLYVPRQHDWTLLPA